MCHCSKRHKLPLEYPKPQCIGCLCLFVVSLLLVVQLTGWLHHYCISVVLKRPTSSLYSGGKNIEGSEKTQQFDNLNVSDVGKKDRCTFIFGVYFIKIYVIKKCYADFIYFIYFVCLYAMFMQQILDHCVYVVQISVLFVFCMGMCVWCVSCMFECSSQSMVFTNVCVVGEGQWLLLSRESYKVNYMCHAHFILP